jgi:PDDEXK-like domain of unknown function (DUF3799)
MPPGVHDGIPEDLYHLDRTALSVSSAKWLLPPSTPAVFKWRRDNPDLVKSSKVFEFGKAAHKTLLGVGPEITYVDALDWKTKAAQTTRKDVEAAGGVALLRAQEGILEEMVAAIRAHPIASRLLAPDTGRPEQSLFAKHESGVLIRGRLDWMPHPVDGRRYIAADYKTADSADPEAFGRKAADYGYDMQAAWYRALLILLKIDPDPAFVFIVQEKAPPYQVNVIALNSEAYRIGRIKNARALHTYQTCVAAGEWPSFPAEVAVAALPVWHTREFEDIAS